MADDPHNLVVYMGKLKLGGGVTSPGLETGRLKPSQSDLEKAINALIESSKAIAAQARKIFLSFSDQKPIPMPTGQELGHISFVRRQARELKAMAESLSNESESYIKAYITSLAGLGTLEARMLSHFGEVLRDIIQHVLNSPCNDFDVLREVLEMCLSECISGRLHPDKYFIPLSEACLGSPYDPDYENEAYYDHEDRLFTDEVYAGAYRARYFRNLDNKRKEEKKNAEQWTRFWIEALNKCYGGPTLFYPPASRHPQCQLARVPRYLFRAFDNESSCTVEGDIVASMESKYPHTGSWRDRIDLLSLNEEDAALMLFKHLKYIDFGVDESNNLVSWSSSLLFVIQCAIWRCYGRSLRQSNWQTPYEVKICAVDTTKFPQGQFAHSRSLLRTYRAIANCNSDMKTFFNFRLENDAYDNGEYLSQGALHHTGRSCVLSLHQLIQAGLHDLYPEFDNLAARKAWSNRVRELRENVWSGEHTTTQLETQQALKIARKCFKNFKASDVALVLLLFKKRKLRDGVLKGLELDNYRPKEVQRYMEIIQKMPSSLNEENWYTSSRHPPAAQERSLEELLDITP